MAGHSKDVNRILKHLQTPTYGCQVKSGGSGHWRVKRPGHQPITIARSPSDRRALDNIKSDVKKYLGIEL